MYASLVVIQWRPSSSIQPRGHVPRTSRLRQRKNRYADFRPRIVCTARVPSTSVLDVSISCYCVPMYGILQEVLGMLPLQGRGCLPCIHGLRQEEVDVGSCRLTHPTMTYVVRTRHISTIVQQPTAGVTRTEARSFAEIVTLAWSRVVMKAHAKTRYSQSEQVPWTSTQAENGKAQHGGFH